MSRALASVIIPTYNAGAFLLDAINSAKNQNVDMDVDSLCVEVIVVDDGSTDASVDVAKAVHGDVFFLSQKNLGAPAARNRGLHAARGDYVVFLDADDFLELNYISKQLEFYYKKEIPHYYIPVCDVGVFAEDLDTKVKTISFKESSRPCDSVYDVLRQVIPISAPLHRREVLLDLNGFFEGLKQGQERDLHLRLALSGKRFVSNRFFGLKVRQHGAPERISNKRFVAIDPWHDFNRSERELDLLRSYFGGKMDERLLRIVAQRFWAGGRRCLRVGLVNEAGVYFERARDLHPTDHVSGGPLYRSAVALLGPRRAERLRPRGS